MMLAEGAGVPSTASGEGCERPHAEIDVYKRQVHGVPWLVERRGKSSHHLFTIHTWPGERDAMLARLGAAGIGTAVNYRAIHLLTYLVEALAIPRGSLPVAEEMGDRTISLPLYPTLSLEDQDRVVDAVADAWGDLAARRG